MSDLLETCDPRLTPRTNMRCAAIDIGTNTVKLTIAERDGAGAFTPVVDTSRTTRLGEGMHAQRLRETAVFRTLDALRDYTALCREHGVAQVAAVGTAALRAAANRDEFTARAREAGVEVEVIPGEEEARLSFLAVRRDPHWRDAGSLLVVDIGGGSTEVIRGDGEGEAIAERVSVPLGAVRLTESALISDPPTIRQMTDANAMARHALQGLTLPAANYTAVGVGGTFVNMAAVHLRMDRPDAERLHGTAFTLSDVEDQVTLYAERTVEERKAIVGLDPARADIILGGAILLCQALSRLRLDGLAVSCRGLRWGVMYDRFG